MSDSKISEKLAESIDNAVKKTKLFDKLNRLEFLIGTFLMIPIVGMISFGITNYYIHKQNKEHHNENSELYDNLNESINEHTSRLESRIYKLEEKIMQLIEQQQLCIKEEEEYSLSESASDISSVTVITEDHMSSTMQIDTVCIEVVSEKNKEICQEKEDDKHKEEDDELINECYDSIPMNNIKKITGVNSLFWFGK